MSESEPGPPFNHRVNGSDAGLLRDSKNQKKTWTYRILEADLKVVNGNNTHIGCQVDISRVTVHAWGSLTDTRVLVSNGDIVRSCSSLVVTSLLW